MAAGKSRVCYTGFKSKTQIINILSTILFKISPQQYPCSGRHMAYTCVPTPGGGGKRPEVQSQPWLHSKSEVILGGIKLSITPNTSPLSTHSFTPVATAVAALPAACTIGAVALLVVLADGGGLAVRQVMGEQALAAFATHTMHKIPEEETSTEELSPAGKAALSSTDTPAPPTLPSSLSLILNKVIVHASQ